MRQKTKDPSYNTFHLLAQHMNETRTVKKISEETLRLKMWKKIYGIWVSNDGESKRWTELNGHQL
jgi:hypothetical protein